MKTEIETAIKALIKKTEKADYPAEAMNYAQAALNLAHTFAIMEAIQQHKNETPK